jgi:hypothetical protein
MKTGIDVLIHRDSSDPENVFCGREIKGVALERQSLILEFTDGTALTIWDDGQSCCESRYVTCDDDINCLIGGKFHSVILKEADDIPTSDIHEICFVDVWTDRSVITLCTHNEHNGYYGGFNLKITERK